MKSVVRVIAPAKINWTLEVLGKRPDGYHEIRSVMQTIFPWDTVVLEESNEITISVRGATRRLRAEPASIRRRAREIETPEHNLAYRAAMVLRERTGYRGGVAIKLDKHIPIAAGLGGGSSDAAAVLRGLRRLWALDTSDEDLAVIGAELGSDVPFFLKGGTAFVAGRGQLVKQLPDPSRQQLVIRPPRWVADHEKTAAMYAAIRLEHFTDGSRTKDVAGRLIAGDVIRDEHVHNAFEGVLGDVDLRGAQLLAEAESLGIGTPHLCGSGPSFFFLRESSPVWWNWTNIGRLRRLGGTLSAHTLPASEALALYDG